MKSAIIIGGGFAGCAWALQLGRKGFDVTLIERLGWLGGGCKTFFEGGHPYTYGPRPLSGFPAGVTDLLEEFTPLRYFRHQLRTYVARDDAFYTFPPHADDIKTMPDHDRITRELAAVPVPPPPPANLEESWLTTVGPTLYGKFVKDYSRKMWQVESNTAIDGPFHMLTRPRIKTGSRDYVDFELAYPKKNTGWDDFFAGAAAAPNVTVRLNTTAEAYDIEKPAVLVDGQWLHADFLVSSISADDLLGQCYGPLPYMGRDFMNLVLPIEQLLPEHVNFLHYANDEPYTRITEYKKLTGHVSPNTLLGLEFPSRKNRLYPYFTKQALELAQKYFDALPEHIIRVGRMGLYKYLGIHDIVAHALETVAQL
ncbi:UDP-galactopyranose mutase-like protein [Solidesulfovibrio fructosivorans JJ]]|uniref:UDP-galactopyranose mutase-like protein n=1 Tax=Solidesulfovibrio fructosivorans JJ] TaxID=596151 RepID=E1JXU5_SOLFR|nr:FAD-dependent oxidoreductase [Solidesulfovibrio fructosivorans]EFL50868.1 UDP-galactopyranose mutase-like protein [Solidesulfovibrio fructosivorans JJ]]